MPMRPRSALLLAIATCVGSVGASLAADSDATPNEASNAAPTIITAANPTPAASPMTPPSPATPATAAKGPGAQGPDEPELQEIVVTGMRASLEKSLDIKKDAAVVLDSINAEELGRFPDADVADSLEHLPGITIDRTTGGEGIQVNVRGLGPQYNIMTLNNRILATDDDSRDLAFDVLPSEVISGADVLKSAQASALEGSIGGTVNLRTASPFDNPGFHGGVHAEGNDNDHVGFERRASSPPSSRTPMRRWDSGISARCRAFGDQDPHRFAQCLQPEHLRTGRPIPFTGRQRECRWPATDPCCITFGSIFDDKKRDALSGSLEWRPNSELKIGRRRIVDPPERSADRLQRVLLLSLCRTDQNGNPTWSNPTVKNGVVTGGHGQSISSRKW